MTETISADSIDVINMSVCVCVCKFMQKQSEDKINFYLKILLKIDR